MSDTYARRLSNFLGVTKPTPPTTMKAVLGYIKALRHKLLKPLKQHQALYKATLGLRHKTSDWCGCHWHWLRSDLLCESSL